MAYQFHILDGSPHLLMQSVRGAQVLVALKSRADNFADGVLYRRRGCRQNV